MDSDYILRKPTTLPLSWIRHNSNSIDFVNVPIHKKCEWISLAKISKHTSPHLVFDHIENQSSKYSIIRGCNVHIKKYLKEKGFGSVYIGKEAVLQFDRNHFEKKSLRELIKRGNKYGKVTELDFNEDNRNKIEEFKKFSAHGKEPQLTNLYFSSFVPSTRMFVFSDNFGNWLGAVQISVNSGNKLHTELLLRRKGAPVGIMEALIFGVFNILKTEGFKEWSLGEVPFVKNENYSSLFSKSFLINFSGRLMKFAYNYKGLYNFKNKFTPRWDDVFLCAKPKVKFSHLLFFITKINLHKLIMAKAIHSII